MLTRHTTCRTLRITRYSWSVVPITTGLVENARTEAFDALTLLLRHSCTTVRTNAARLVIKLVRVNENVEDQALLDSLIVMGHGTCREQQTFVWACEAALVRA